ncbi:hypothetical protein RUND412_006293 [Rhizina undulata]
MTSYIHSYVHKILNLMSTRSFSEDITAAVEIMKSLDEKLVLAKGMLVYKIVASGVAPELVREILKYSSELYEFLDTDILKYVTYSQQDSRHKVNLEELKKEFDRFAGWLEAIENKVEKWFP